MLAPVGLYHSGSTAASRCTWRVEVEGTLQPRDGVQVLSGQIEERHPEIAEVVAASLTVVVQVHIQVSPNVGQVVLEPAVERVSRGTLVRFRLVGQHGFDELVAAGRPPLRAPDGGQATAHDHALALALSRGHWCLLCSAPKGFGNL